MGIMRTTEQERDFIATYVKASVVPAKEGRKCVDGRYHPQQSPGMIARPGGDCGYVLALLALNKKKKLGLSPQDCFNAVYKVVSPHCGFCMHTDHHVDPSPDKHLEGIGCGHVERAGRKRLCKQYHLCDTEVKEFVRYARNVKGIVDHVHMTNLEGEHQESGVLIVDSEKYSVLAENPALHQMYFVYDAQRDDTFLKLLVEKMHLAGVSYRELKAESDHQLKVTLQQLALGLPIYHVQFKDDKPVVTSLGVVKKTSRFRNYFPKYALHFMPRLSRFIARF
jgi:hypothetical protein